MLEAVSVLHAADIVHGDIKTDNFVLRSGSSSSSSASHSCRGPINTPIAIDVCIIDFGKAQDMQPLGQSCQLARYEDKYGSSATTMTLT
jgi:serine/threonine protein kinase